ncbi:MAG: hypothetical protein ABIH36_00375 [bacterium]
MTVHVFIVGSLVAAIVSWTIWVAIIKFLDPVQAGTIGFLLFFLALFLAAASTAGLVGYVIRHLFAPRQLSAYAVRTSLRQGILLGLFLDLLLLLQLLHFYRWWLALLAIAIFIFIEFIFLGYDRATRRTTSRA